MYEDKSDLEVNRILSRLSGEVICDAQPASMRIKLSEVLVKTGGRTRAVDYCNSWADIGPLIDKYWDDLNEEDQFGISRWDQAKCSLGVKATKAAAICILKRLESEK